jgi:hypothetical protein
MQLNICKGYILLRENQRTDIWEHKLCQPSITPTDSITDQRIFTDTKPHFYNHVNHIFSPFYHDDGSGS